MSVRALESTTWYNGSGSYCYRRARRGKLLWMRRSLLTDEPGGTKRDNTGGTTCYKMLHFQRKKRGATGFSPGLNAYSAYASVSF